MSVRHATFQNRPRKLFCRNGARHVFHTGAESRQTATGQFSLLQFGPGPASVRESVDAVSARVFSWRRHLAKTNWRVRGNVIPL